NLQAEVVRRDVLECVRLIEDDDLVVGQKGGPGAAQGEVTEEQRMIHDEDLRPAHRPAGLEVEASAVISAFAAQAVAVIAFDEVPDLRRGLEIEVAAAPVVRLARPAAELR